LNEDLRRSLAEETDRVIAHVFGGNAEEPEERAEPAQSAGIDPYGVSLPRGEVLCRFGCFVGSDRRGGRRKFVAPGCGFTGLFIDSGRAVAASLQTAMIL
jgi:hypothetical protein